MRIHGRCHCGNIGFELHWAPTPSRIPARACGCSFCRRHGGVWTACPAGSLQVTVRDAARMTRYAFGTRTAQFLVCAECGVMPVAISEIDARVYAVVNVNTFEDVDPALLEPMPVSFDDEREDERLARRRRHWIADVELVIA